MRARALVTSTFLVVTGCGGRTPLDLVTATREDAGTAGSLDGAADAPIDSAPDGCFGEGVVAIAAAEALPLDLAIDSTNVYWVDNGHYSGCAMATGSVRRAPKAGGPSTVLAGGELGPVAITIDDTSAYWADDCGSGRIRATSLDGGGAVRELPTPPTTFFTNDRFLAVVGPDVYFNSDSEGMLAMPKDGSGMEHPLPGDSNDYVYGLAADATGVYWAALVGGTGGTYAVLSYVPSIGHVTTVDTPAFATGAVAVDDAWVYYVNDTTFSRAPKSGGPSMTVGPRDPGIVVALAVDDTNLYWSGGVGAPPMPTTILEMPKSGGAVSTVTSGANWVHRIAVDDRCVYWVEGDINGGRVMRAPK
jgi:hypothetical protein